LFFRKKIKNIYAITLVKNIIEKLPHEYDFLKNQVNEGIIKNIELNKNFNCWKIFHDLTLLSKYKIERSPGFFMENIQLKQKGTNNEIDASLIILENILEGYYVNTQDADIAKIDLENINVNNLKTKYINSFPKIKGNQIVLLKAEASTGIVLNKNFTRNSLYDRDGQIYTVFENIDLAKKYIDEKIKIHANTEYIIYGKDETVLYCSNEISELIRQKNERDD
jgi:hypothetical protein